MPRRYTPLPEANGWATVARAGAAGAGPGRRTTPRSDSRGSPSGPPSSGSAGSPAGPCWRCPACSMPDNWPERQVCRRCQHRPSRLERVRAEEATLAAGRGGGRAGPRGGAPPAPRTPRPSPPKGGELGTPRAAPSPEEPATPGGDGPKAATPEVLADLKARAAKLARAVEDLRSLGEPVLLGPLEQRAQELQRQLDAERPASQRLGAAQARLCKSARALDTANSRVATYRAALAAAESVQARAREEHQAAVEAEEAVRASLAALPPRSETAPAVPAWMSAMWEDVLANRVSTQEACVLHRWLGREPRTVEVVDDDPANIVIDDDGMAEAAPEGRAGRGEVSSPCRDRAASRSPYRHSAGWAEPRSGPSPVAGRLGPPGA